MQRIKTLLRKFLVAVTGFEASAVATVSAKVRKQILFLGLLMLVVPLLMGTILGSGIAFLEQSVWFGIAFFLGYSTVIYLIDRSLVDGRQEKQPRWLTALRFVAILGSSLLFAVCVEPVMLHDDIHNEVLRRFEAELDDQVAEREASIDELEAEYDVLLIEVGQLEEEKKKEFNRIHAEAEGKGPTGKPGYSRGVNAASELYNRYVHDVYTPAWMGNDAERERVQEAIGRERQRIAEIKQTPFEFFNLSMGEQILISHEIAWRDKRYDILLLFLGYILLAISLELLPLWYRHGQLDFKAYLAAADLHAQTNLQIQEGTEQLVRLREEARVRVDADRIRYEVTKDRESIRLSVINDLCTGAGGAIVLRFINQTKNCQDLYDSMEAKLKEVPHEYHDTLWIAFNRAHAELKQLLEDDTSDYEELANREIV